MTICYTNSWNKTTPQILDEIDLFGHAGDVIGDAYEYLIGQFAAGAGKKAGEFYTPQAVSKIISEIVAIGQEDTAPFTTYNLARMNLILHSVEQSQMRLRNGDTLDEDWPTDEP